MTLKVDAAEVIIDLLQRGHAVEFRAHGDSMHPVIREHDSLHVEPTQQCKVGDVILARAERGLTAHRVLAVRADAIITRGDNTPAPDPPLPRTRILGKVTWVERDGKRRGVGREFFVLRALRKIRLVLSRRKSGAAGFSTSKHFPRHPERLNGARRRCQADDIAPPVIPSVARDLGGWGAMHMPSATLPPGPLATLGVTDRGTPLPQRVVRSFSEG